MPIPATLQFIGVVHSPLLDPAGAPRQGDEGAPEVWLEFAPEYRAALEGLVAGQAVLVLTWLHQADRAVLRVHPRGDLAQPLAGVFATRSPHRPNPLGLHRVTIRAIEGLRLRVGPLEAVDGTPIVDLKPVLETVAEA